MAIGGYVIRLPHFSYGRSMGPSAAYDCWHPLEWFSKDPDSLFAEYLRYRELTTAAIIRRPDNEHLLDEIHGMLDLIHLRYLAQHTPDSAVQFIVEQQIAGANFAEYWPTPRNPFAALRRRRNSGDTRAGNPRSNEHPRARPQLSPVPQFLRASRHRISPDGRHRSPDQRPQRLPGGRTMPPSRQRRDVIRADIPHAVAAWPRRSAMLIRRGQFVNDEARS